MKLWVASLGLKTCEKFVVPGPTLFSIEKARTWHERRPSTASRRPGPTKDVNCVMGPGLRPAVLGLRICRVRAFSIKNKVGPGATMLIFAQLLTLLLGYSTMSWAANYEAQLPALQGGALAGYVGTVVINRTPAPMTVQVQLVAEEKDTGTLYTYPVNQATIGGETFNPVTGELASTGKTLFTWDLQQANFAKFARVTVKVSAPADPPAVTWVSFLTARRGTQVLFWIDSRKFRKL